MVRVESSFRGVGSPRRSVRNVLDEIPDLAAEVVAELVEYLGAGSNLVVGQPGQRDLVDACRLGNFDKRHHSLLLKALFCHEFLKAEANHIG